MTVCLKLDTAYGFILKRKPRAVVAAQFDDQLLCLQTWFLNPIRQMFSFDQFCLIMNMVLKKPVLSRWFAGPVHKLKPSLDRYGPISASFLIYFRSFIIPISIKVQISTK